MKVYIGPFDHWFRPAYWLRSLILNLYGFNNKHWYIVKLTKYQAADEYDKLESWISDLWVYRCLQAVERWFNRGHRKIRIHVDGYDVWNLCDTVAILTLPLMYEFKRQGIHGAPHVYDEDVPEYLRSSAAPPLSEVEKQTGGVDKLWHQRWNWVVDEIIWALEQTADPESDSQFHTDANPDKPRDEPGISLQKAMKRGKYDFEGHKAFCERKRNGLILFGKYLEALWN